MIEISRWTRETAGMERTHGRNSGLGLRIAPFLIAAFVFATGACTTNDSATSAAFPQADGPAVIATASTEPITQDDTTADPSNSASFVFTLGDFAGRRPTPTPQREFSMYEALAPAANRPHWVVVGTLTVGDRTTPAAWVSETDDIGAAVATPLADDEGYAYGVAASGDIVIAVGAWNDVDAGHSPAIWRFDAGRWSEVLPLLPRTPNGIAYFTRVLAADTALIATAETVVPGTTLLVSHDHGASWNQVRFDSTDDPSTVVFKGIAVMNDQLLAIGWNDAQPGPGVVWTSADQGLSWTRAKTSGLEPDVDGVILSSLAKFKGQLVVAGSTWTNDEYSPAVWTSADGAIWQMQEASFTTTRYGDTARGISSLVTDDTRLVALATGPGPAEVWTSTDGITWNALGGIRETGPENGRRFRDLDLGLDGAVVAVEGVGKPIVYRAGTWARTGSDEAFPQETEVDDSDGDLVAVNEVAWNDGRFVAVGSGTEAGSSGVSARIWWSDDGTVWHRGVTDPPEGPGLSAVTATTAGFVAVDAAYEQAPRQFWYSADGQSWEHVASLGSELELTLIDELAATSNGVFAVGTHTTTVGGPRRSIMAFGPANAQSLTSSIGDDTTEGQISTAICSNTELTVAFRRSARQAFTTTYDIGSDDVRNETTIVGLMLSPDSLAVFDCVWTGDEFVAVGVETGGTSDSAAVWRSADGETWTPDESFAAVVGSTITLAADIAAFDGGVVVVGQDSRVQHHAVLWVHYDDRWWVVDPGAGNETALNVIVKDIVIAEGQIVAPGFVDRYPHIWTASLDELLGSLQN